MARHEEYTPEVSSGGCAWFGHAPFCSTSLPYSGRCIYRMNMNLDGQVLIKEPKNFTLTDSLRQAYGHGCALSTMKKWCCIADRKDKSWEGYWISMVTGQTYFCNFVNYEDRTSSVFRPQCGRLLCGVEIDATNFELQITNRHCNKLSFGELIGNARLGVIHWQTKDGNETDSWFKVNENIA